LNFRWEMTSPETQVGRLRSRNEELTADLAELKGVKELVAGLEGELAARDQALSLLEQRLSHLAEELDQEKKSRELLSSELSSKVDLIAELQQKLENSQPNSLAFEAEIENSTIKINELQEQLLNLKAERASAETQLGQLRSHNAELTADNQELNSLKKRVVRARE